jgi:regulator of sigma E protease
MNDPIYLLVTAVVFVTMISILVAAHELGHYLFARMFNMGVEEFAIGFGKRPLVTYGHRSYTLPLPADSTLVPGEVLEQISEASSLEGGAEKRRVEVVETPTGKALKETTNFTIRPWPLGGFVRIKGMMPEEDGSETSITGGFYSKPPWQRLLVLFAGPLFSVLAGIAILIPLYMSFGIDRPTNDPVVTDVVVGGQAGKAGLKPGDRFVSVDGVPVRTFYDYLSKVRDGGDRKFNIVVDRAGKSLSFEIQPKWNEMPTPVLDADLNETGELRRQAIMGIAFPPVQPVQLSFLDASSMALRTPVQAVVGLASIVKRPSTFKESVGGPGTIVAATGAAVKLGINKVLWLAAMLSISVGIFNLLPIVPLDGGQMAVAFVELFRGRRLSMRVQNAVAAVGFCFVIALVGGVLFVDITRFAGPKPTIPKKQMMRDQAPNAPDAKP